MDQCEFEPMISVYKRFGSDPKNVAKKITTPMNQNIKKQPQSYRNQGCSLLHLHHIGFRLFLRSRSLFFNRTTYRIKYQ